MWCFFEFLWVSWSLGVGSRAKCRFFSSCCCGFSENWFSHSGLLWCEGNFGCDCQMRFYWYWGDPVWGRLRIWSLQRGLWLLCGTSFVSCLSSLGFCFWGSLKVKVTIVSCSVVVSVLSFYDAILPSSNWLCKLLDLYFVFVCVWFLGEECKI